MTKLLELLSEVFDTYYKVKERDMTVPEKGATKGIAIFYAENKKFIIEIYQYPNDFYLIAYYPKLNRDFAKSSKQPNKYRIQLNLKNPYKVLGTVFKYMSDIFKHRT